MERNRIKIVYRQDIRQTSFYSQNENGKWQPVPSDSVLSRNTFTQGDFREKVQSILQAINDSYNLASRGVDIVFDGPADGLAALSTCIETTFANKGIACEKKRVVIVAGKTGSGKTTLIEALCEFSGCRYSQIPVHDCIQYICDSGSVEFHGLPGIELGKGYILRAGEIIQTLGKAGATHLIYCVSTNRMENTECEFLREIHQDFPRIAMLVVLTCCLYENTSQIADDIWKNLPFVKVCPVLAKDKKTRAGVIPAYGIDQLADFIF